VYVTHENNNAQNQLINTAVLLCVWKNAQKQLVRMHLKHSCAAMYECTAPGNSAYHCENNERDKWRDEEVESHVHGPDACHSDGVRCLLSPNRLQQF